MSSKMRERNCNVQKDLKVGNSIPLSSIRPYFGHTIGIGYNASCAKTVTPVHYWVILSWNVFTFCPNHMFIYPRVYGIKLLPVARGDGPPKS